MSEIVRSSFYFKRGDTRISQMLDIPDISLPRAKDLWQIIECGEPTSTIPEEQLQRLDPKWRDTYARAEKGLDTRMACDALVLASTDRIKDFLFFVNDRDFVPVFEAIQRFGCNVYLTGLDDTSPQRELLNLSDRYDNLKEYLPRLFKNHD